MLGRQFNRLMKKIDVRSKANVKNIASDISKSNNIGRRTRSDENPKKKKEFSAMNVMGMDTLELNIGPTSRNRRGVLLPLGQMEVKQKNLQIL